MARPTLPEKTHVAVRHDFCRAIYLALLDRLPSEDIIRFYSECPLLLPGDGEVAPLSESLRLLWKEKAFVSMQWLYKMGECLEQYLVARGIEPFAFLRKALWRNNQGSHMPGKVILSWFSPKLAGLFKSFDGRDSLISMFPHFTENFLPFHLHRRLRKEAAGDWVSSYLAYIIDRDFEIVYEWNFELIAGSQIRYSPQVLGLPPFEEVTILSDTRSLERVTWIREIDHRSDGLWLEGVRLAVPIQFSAFCTKHGLDLSGYAAPDPIVYLAERDWACPLRGRVVLHAGCAYQAPLFLHVVRHLKRRKGNETLLDPMLRDAVEENALPNGDLEAKHLDLLTSLNNRIRCEYLSAEELLLMNGKPFMKGLAAKILKNLIRYHLQSGKTEFEYWEFKKNHDITGGGKAQNFEIRFMRLMHKLEEENAGILIEKSGRGRFRLRLHGAVEWKESKGFEGF